MFNEYIGYKESFAENIIDFFTKTPELYKYTVYISSIIYIITIFTVQKFIRSLKNPAIFDKPLKPLLFVWNILLAIFSLLSAINIALRSTQIDQYVCNNGLNYYVENVDERFTVAFMLLFGYSKIVEFGDTAFIVLRNKRLIFLHWFHHVLTAIVSYHIAVTMHPGGIWIIGMNSIIHTLMYTYYGISCYYKMKEPIFLTVMQIVQMFIGLWISVVTLKCNDINPNVNYVMIGMFVSYILLFVNFFINKYIVKRKQIDKEKQD